MAEYWHQVIKINDYQKNRFAQKIIDDHGGDLTGKTIAILGWAFKANTNDSRESPAIKVSEILYNSGAFLSIYDPMVKKKTISNDIENLWEINGDLIENRIDIVEKLSDINQVDAFAILTEWEEFNLIDNKESIVIFDGRNINQNKNKFSIGK